MNDTIYNLLRRLSETDLVSAGVIPWSCPVPAFGDLRRAFIATVGLNPSNREFVDESGNELKGSSRRFHTLNSLGLERWSNARNRHVALIAEACTAYFNGNPYDTWFRRLDYILSDTSASYYGCFAGACHLDLIPYATSSKWTALTRCQRETLFDIAGDALGLLLKDSDVRLLILNGRSVVEQFEAITASDLERIPMSGWELPRKNGSSIPGVAYTGTIRSVAGIGLMREVAVFGFNHNIQSSFGVTRGVVDRIRKWIGAVSVKVLD